MVSDVFLEQLRNACPLEEIARTYVDLKRRGRTYVCNCPFHSEKTPSFTVFPDTQSFYCFGCGAGGDVITLPLRIAGIGPTLQLVHLFIEGIDARVKRILRGEEGGGHQLSLGVFRKEIAA